MCCLLQLLLKVKTAFEANWYTDIMIAHDCSKQDGGEAALPTRVR